MELEYWHEKENELKEEIEQIDPNHDSLKIIFCSTYEAVEYYQDILMRLRGDKDEDNA
ncbi:MAG: hypothetical protein ACOC2U_01740 [bacterium]